MAHETDPLWDSQRIQILADKPRITEQLIAWGLLPAEDHDPAPPDGHQQQRRPL